MNNPARSQLKNREMSRLYFLVLDPKFCIEISIE